VTEITHRDEVTGREDVTRYAYHEGRFDGVLREVCGFARVLEETVGDERVPTLRTTRTFETGATADGGEPATADERLRLRAIRGRLARQDRQAADGYLFDRIEHAWEVVGTDAPGVVRPRLRRSATFRFEGQAAAVSSIATETVAWDDDGNVVESLEQSLDAAAGVTSALRTRVAFAADPRGRYRQRIARITQEDGTGTIVADSVVEYDGLPYGEVGTEGLVTARWALALRDDTVQAVYGAATPDFAGLGYERRPDGDGWWLRLARYQRTDDAAGLRGTVTGPRGGVTQLGFDPARCYPVSVVGAMGNTLTATFDPRVYQPTVLVDAAGDTSTAHFDALARLTAVVEPGDTLAEPTVGYAYRTDVLPVEAITTRRSAPGAAPHVTRQLFDGDGRLLECRTLDDAGEIVEAAYQYGPRGLPVRSYLPGRPASPSWAAPEATAPHAEVRYDAVGRSVGYVRPDGEARTVRYLPGLIEETDERGARTLRSLDAAGRVTRVEAFDGAVSIVSTYRTDVKGQLVEQTDPEGNRTSFVYDLLGRLLRVTRPEATQIAIFDAASNVVESRAGSARVLRRFDLENRLVEVRHGTPAAAPVVRCTYHDAGLPAPADAGAHTGGGRLVRVDDEAGTTVLDYDERGRIATKVMTPAGAAPLRVDLTHRPDGLVDSVTGPGPAGGRPVARYRYDRRGLLTAIDGYVDEIAYDLSGQRLLTRYANGLSTREEHDPLAGWRTRLWLDGPDGTLRDQGYSFDAGGNVLAITSPDPKLRWTYRYDGLARLVEADAPDGTWQYSYDRSGNLLTSSDAGAYSYGGAGAAATCVSRVGTRDFTYDDRGHVRTAPWGVHSVDDEGRLRRIDLVGSGWHELTYDHAGTLARRRSVDADGTVREVLMPDRLVVVDGGVPVFQVWDGEQVVAQARGGTCTWLHYDHLGSFVLATDAAGAVLASARYGPYGTVLEHTGSILGHGFATGDPALPELLLLGARWYCPGIGRFLSPDPLVSDAYDALAWNAYAYCHDNPVSMHDPTGEQALKVLGMILAAVAIVLVVVIVSVVTWGTATPATVAVGGVTWGMIWTATMVGVVAGGVVGGIAAARAGGDAGDVLLGVLVGGAVGGWAAFGAAVAGPALALKAGLLGGLWGGVLSGAVSGTINGAAMGFASGFAGGRAMGFMDVFENVLVGALIGGGVGAGLGAASYFRPPGGSLGQAVGQAVKSEIPSDPGSMVPVSNSLPGAGAPPVTPVNTMAGAGNTVAPAFAGKSAAIVLPYLLAPLARIAPILGSPVVQAIAVNVHAGVASVAWDDLKRNLNFGPIQLPKFPTP